jgi:hypothetical protein
MRINTDKLKAFLGTTDAIINGDDIFISTHRGEKSVTLLRGGDRYNIINCLDRYPDWFQLSRGDNLFTYRAEEGATNLQFRVEHRTAYEGV